MRVIDTEIEDVKILEPTVYFDDRGYFFEGFHARKLAELGIREEWVQDNQSQSKLGTIRGLHAQSRHPQAKLVRVVLGEVFDVAVDIRPESSTFGQWVGARLSSQNHRAMYLPRGFAHGFCALSEQVIFQYKCSDFYDPAGEIAIRWDDPDLAIDWPIADPLVADKDRAAGSFAELARRLAGAA
ncbi:MAG: dTDP-4-dehydrorhamnose 3,5-epimerase [Acidobacteriota bacterium]